MQIEITEKAEEDLQKLDDYLLTRWDKKVLMNFYTKLEIVLEHIKSGQIKYQLHQNRNYSKVLITKHNTLVYQKTDSKITIIRIINNFQSEENRRIE